MQNFDDLYVICIKLQIYIAYYPYAVIGVLLPQLNKKKNPKERKKKII